eukprot:7109065-Karenia_brevis.AAC.1
MVVSRINDLNNQFDRLSRFVDDAISTWKNKYEKLDVRVDKLEARPTRRLRHLMLQGMLTKRLQ